MFPAKLRRLLLRFDPGGPIHLKLEANLRAGRLAKPWYRDQREHLLGWLGEYSGPGAYGRADGDRTAAFVYNHFQCAPGLAWMAEAGGVPAHLLKAACGAALAAGPRSSAQCGAFRRVIPWAMVEARLIQIADQRPPSAVRVRSRGRIALPAGANDNSARAIG